eukprot:scaffold117866_cov69-Phaeocystis_antarctica.AAC.1
MAADTREHAAFVSFGLCGGFVDIVEQALPEGGGAGGDGFGRGVGGGWGALGGEAKGYASISRGLQRALYCAGGWLLDLCDGLLGCPGLCHLALAGGCPVSLVVRLLVSLPPRLVVLCLQLRFLATE